MIQELKECALWSRINFGLHHVYFCVISNIKTLKFSSYHGIISNDGVIDTRSDMTVKLPIIASFNMACSICAESPMVTDGPIINFYCTVIFFFFQYFPRRYNNGSWKIINSGLIVFAFPTVWHYFAKGLLFTTIKPISYFHCIQNMSLFDHSHQSICKMKFISSFEIISDVIVQCFK